MNKIEKLNREINDHAYALTNLIIELYNDYGIDRRKEIIDYMIEKLKVGGE